MSENLRHSTVRFKTLCDNILVLSKKHHRNFRGVEIRVKKIVAEFGEKPVDKIKRAFIFTPWIITNAALGEYKRDIANFTDFPTATWS